ncbi:MAG: hypothetical protein ACPL7J_01315, partial [Desulfomonilaceae bacterium]
MIHGIPNPSDHTRVGTAKDNEAVNPRKKGFTAFFVKGIRGNWEDTTVIREAIEKSVSGKSLSEEEMTEAIEEIMDGGATQAQIGAFLVALRMKGESIEEITAAAKVMRSKSYAIPHEWGVDDRLVDTCGTGGDCANSFNISTTAAFVVAGAG